MPAFREFTFKSTNGATDIYARRYDPDGGARGIVQIAHGVSEYCARYDAFMRALAENGYIAVASDHLGHGRSVNSPDELGWFADKNGWNIVVNDLKKLHDETAAERPDLPYVLFGHSMGSFLCRTYIINYPDDLDGAIICGTGRQAESLLTAGKAVSGAIIALRGSKYRSGLLDKMAFGSYCKNITPHRTESDWLTRDDAVVDAYTADPLCGGKISAGLFRDMMGGISYIGKAENIAKMRKDMPVLLIAGACDPVGEEGKGPRIVADAFKAAGIEDVTLKLYPDCRHELLNELNRDAVTADILEWTGRVTAGGKRAERQAESAQSSKRKARGVSRGNTLNVITGERNEQKS